MYVHILNAYITAYQKLAVVLCFLDDAFFTTHKCLFIYTIALAFGGMARFDVCVYSIYVCISMYVVYIFSILYRLIRKKQNETFKPEATRIHLYPRSGK